MPYHIHCNANRNASSQLLVMPDKLSVPDLNVAKNNSDALLSLDLPGGTSWSQRRHLLDTADLTLDEIEGLMALANVCKKLQEISPAPLAVLNDKTIANLFYENSTRTRSSFELAAKRLGATVLNLDIGTSSVAKGETLEDTASTLISMGVNVLVQRHSSAGAAHKVVAKHGERVHVINAGDGWHSHPTQALLDLFTMRESCPDLNNCKIAMVGDITHSRVARSNIWLLKRLGADVHVAGPPTMLPPKLAQLGVTVHTRIEPAIKDADFVMTWRLQLERQKQGLIPSMEEYKRLYRLDHGRLAKAKPEVKVLHPGPSNRGAEITGELLDDTKFSLVTNQVTNGIAVRMAVLYLLLARDKSNERQSRKDQ